MKTKMKPAFIPIIIMAQIGRVEPYSLMLSKVANYVLAILGCTPKTFAKQLAFAGALSALTICRPATCCAQDANTQAEEVSLATGWRVRQDTRDLGEISGWQEPDLMTTETRELMKKAGDTPDAPDLADWQPIGRLAHLQLLLAPQPYFGRDLRYFNDSPWWYRVQFPTPDIKDGATLRFGGIDYFAKVWLNGELLGEHEGYADPFEFEVGPLLNKGRPNVLVVKVSSPWDHKYITPLVPQFSVVRNLIKGSYEHADGFVQRDVNPVGIWRPVKLILHGELRQGYSPCVTADVAQDHRSTTVKVAWPVVNDGQPVDADYIVHIRELGSPEDVATGSLAVRLEQGSNALEQSVVVPSPRLWTTWDRGTQPLYDASVEIAQSGAPKLRASVTFGIRTVELHRTENETRFYLNGGPVYLRGTTYWPDIYLSNMTRARYERDIKAALRAGINAFRVHVHTENPEFYELCDRLGIVVIQDNDLNWVFPTDAEFTKRAVHHFGSIVKLLRNHPSVIAWIAMNEVFWGQDQEMLKTLCGDLKKSDAKAMGASLTAEAQRLDPTRPIIENSGISTDLASGDIHDYRGSLNGGTSTYFDIATVTPNDWFGAPPKLVTEFGVDAPAAAASLRNIPELARRLGEVLPRMAELHDYQYRLIKYYIEHYRIHKYAPNAGYFQFMWIDFSPQSFYGVYDYWGVPKSEGLGGGVRAMEESNQPVGIFMEHTTEPQALYTVNDTSADLGDCVAHWRVSTSREVIADDSQTVRLRPDSHQKIRDLRFPVKQGEPYTVVLELTGPQGETLAHNSYSNPFQLQPRPEGYPDRMDDELGMRLWWADKRAAK